MLCLRSSSPSAFPIAHLQNAFNDDSEAQDNSYDKRIVKFLDEYEWYAKALEAARTEEACSNEIPV